MKLLRIIIILVITIFSGLFSAKCQFQSPSSQLHLRMTLTWGNVFTTGKIKLPEGDIELMEGYGLENGDTLDTDTHQWKTIAERLKPGSFDGVSFHVKTMDTTTLIITFNDKVYSVLMKDFMRNRRISWEADNTKLTLTGIPIPGSKQLPDFPRSIHSWCLQAHSCFSDATFFTLWEQIASLSPYVDNVWWTDHDFWFSNNHEGAGMNYPGTGPDCPGSDSNNGSLHLQQTFYGQRAEYFLGPLAKSLKPLVSGITFSFWIHPNTDFDENTGAFIQLEFGPERKLLYYLFSNQETIQRDDTIVLPYKPGTWNFYDRDVTADYQSLYGDEQLALWFAKPGGFSSNSQPVDVYFDQFKFEYKYQNKALWQLQKQYLLQFEEYIHSLCGLELTANFNGTENMDLIDPHYTVLFPPDREDLFYIPRGNFDFPVREKYFEKIHANGGVVGAHHFNFPRIRNIVINRKVRGIDLYEINYDWGLLEPLEPDEVETYNKLGYPSDPVLSVYHCLTGWDECTANGVYLTGYSAPDLHGSFNTPRYIIDTQNAHLSPGLTWIYSTSNDPDEILRSLRVGQCYFGDSVDPIIMDMEAEYGFPMGSVILTDRKKWGIKVMLKGALKGKTLHFIKNGAVEKKVRLYSDEFEKTFGISIDEATFVRCELYDQYGHPVLFSNWIKFIHEMPREYPWGRNGLYWDGIHINGSHQLYINRFAFSPDNKSIIVEADSWSPGSLLHIATDKYRDISIDAAATPAEDNNGYIVLKSDTTGKQNYKITFKKPLQKPVPLAPKKPDVFTRVKEIPYHRHQLLFMEPFREIVKGDIVALTMDREDVWQVENGTIEIDNNQLTMKGDEDSLFCVTFNSHDLHDKVMYLDIPDITGKTDVYISLNYDTSELYKTINEPGNYIIHPGKSKPAQKKVARPVPVLNTYDKNYEKKKPVKFSQDLTHGDVIVSLVFQMKQKTRMVVEGISLNE